MQKPRRPRRKKPGGQKRLDPWIAEEERQRARELRTLVANKIAELPGPRVFGLEDPQTRGWLEAPDGLSQLKPQDLDRVIHMLRSLDLLFMDLIGGTNPNENWRATLLSKTIEALRVELEKPKHGKYPDALNPNNSIPPATQIRLQIRAEAVRFDECYGMAKPKGMHHTTFVRLRLKLFRLERLIERELHQSIR